MTQFPIYVQPRSFDRPSCPLTFIQCDIYPVDGRTACSPDFMIEDENQQ